MNNFLLKFQLKTIGIQKSKDGTADMSVLTESLKQLRSQLTPNSPANAAAFQDHVEAQIKVFIDLVNTQ
jgi:hypothetical protein